MSVRCKLLIYIQNSGLYYTLRYTTPVTGSSPGGSVVKNPPAKIGDMGSIPGSGRAPGERNDNLLQNSCLENPMHRGP